MPDHPQTLRSKLARQTIWPPAQLARVQRELDGLAAAGHLSPQAAAVLQDLLNAAKSSLTPAERGEREKLWNEIESAWPQLAEAMLSRLSEILQIDGRMKSSKQGFAPRENIFD